MNTYSLNTYKSIAEGMKLSEVYLGTAAIQWNYAIVGYKATCTEGLDLSLFDKTICGILNLDGAMSVERLGEILGLNVISDIDNGRYADRAEMELLTDAVNSLIGYKMIEQDIATGNINLSDIGHEYYEKGRKFKTTNNQEFSVYFDITSGNHARAKEIFEFMTGMNTESPYRPMYRDEAALKSFIHEQLPDIYDTEKGNSFTDLRLEEKREISCPVRFAVLYDVQVKKYRFVGFTGEGDSQTESAFFTEVANSNEEIGNLIVAKFLENKKAVDDPVGADAIEEFELLASEAQGMYDFNKYNNEDPTEFAENFQAQRMIFEPESFWNNIQDFVKPDTDKVFFNFGELSQDMYIKLGLLAQNSPELRMFVLYRDSLEDIEDHSGYSFFHKAPGAPSRVFCCGNDCYYQYVDYILPGGNGKSIQLVQKVEDTEENMLKLEKKLFDNFATIFVPKLYQQTMEYLDTPFEGKKRDVAKIPACDASLMVFSDYIEDEKKKALSTKKLEVFNAVKKRHEDSLIEKLTKEQEDKDIEAQTKVDILQLWKGKVDEILVHADASYIRLNEQASLYKSKINDRIQTIRDELMSKAFIFDTNSLLEDPDILMRIGRKDKIVIPLTVYEELEKLKAKLAGQEKGEKAKTARRHIDDLRKKDNGKKRRIFVQRANMKLIPEDLLVVNKYNPDNYVLAVAYEFLKANPYIITNDNGLQTKASAVGSMSTMTVGELDAFLKSVAEKKTAK